MNKNQNNIKNDNCLNSIPFNIIGIFIIIFESISLIMSILCLVLTSWNFLKHFIKILNIISLAIISLIIIINTILFLKIKNQRYDIRKNYNYRMNMSSLLFLLYIIIIIFNIYNSIYLSIRLHIADFPEYGGRKRDQKYIDKHPNEFGFVPLKQFIIVGLCPSIISLLNIFCIIFSIVFRQKIIKIHNNISQTENNNGIKRLNEVNEITNGNKKIIKRHKYINRHRNRNKIKFTNDTKNNTKDIMINNDSNPNIERKDKNIKEDKKFVDAKISNRDDKEKHIKKTTNILNMNNKLDNKDISKDQKKGNSNELKLFNIKSSSESKSSFSDKDK